MDTPDDNTTVIPESRAEIIELREAVIADIAKAKENLARLEGLKRRLDNALAERSTETIIEPPSSPIPLAITTDISKKASNASIAAPLSYSDGLKQIEEGKGFNLDKFQAIPSTDGKGHYLVPRDLKFWSVIDQISWIKEFFDFEGDEKDLKELDITCAARLMSACDIVELPYTEGRIEEMNCRNPATCHISKRGKLKLNAGSIAWLNEQRELRRPPSIKTMEELLRKHPDKSKWKELGHSSLIGIEETDPTEPRVTYIIPNPDRMMSASNIKTIYNGVDDENNLASDYKIIQVAYIPTSKISMLPSGNALDMVGMTFLQKGRVEKTRASL
jgi:hypothetical protein